MPTAAPAQPIEPQSSISTPTPAQSIIHSSTPVIVTPSPASSISAMSPLSIDPARQFDLDARIISLALIDLTGGGLPDIVAATENQQVHALSLDWPPFNQWFTSHAVVLQTGDMNRNGLGDIFLGGNDGLVTAMEGDFSQQRFALRGSYNAMGQVTAVTTITSYDIPRLIVGTATGQLLSLNLPLELNWSQTIDSNGRITLIKPHALLENSTNLLVGTSSGKLLALTDSGNRQWEKEMPAAITAIALVDITGDGKEDLVVGDAEGNVLAFNFWGVELWRWYSGGQVLDIQIAKSSAVEKTVMLVGVKSGIGEVAALDRNGNVLWHTVVGYPLTAFDVADVDGDGHFDVIAGTANGTILILDYEGAVRSTYNLPAAVTHLYATYVDYALLPKIIVASDSIVYLLEVTQGSVVATLPATPQPGWAFEVDNSLPSFDQKADSPIAGAIPPRPQYLLDVDLDYFDRTAYVTMTVTVPNHTGRDWTEIIFHASPLYWRDLFRLSQLTVSLDGRTEIVTPTIDVTMIRIPLPRPIAADESVQLEFNYGLFLPRLNPLGWGPVGNAGWGPEVIQMGDWYPALVPYDEDRGEWQTWVYRPVGDPVRSIVADYEVRITAPPSVILAAPGYLRTEAQTSYYRLEKGRAFSFLASPSYVIFEGQSQAAPVKLYVLAKHRHIGPTVLDNIVRSLNLFHNQFGPYPYPELIMAENGFLTAMEYSAIVSLSSFAFTAYDSTPQSLLTALTAHEVAHQWWYGAVGNDQVLQPWLDESLSMYGELLYYETYHPEYVDWWWQFRVDRWRPTGYVDVTIYDYNDSETFVHNMYGRSAHFIRDLRSHMGAYDFNLFLQEYYRRYRFQTATSADFLTLAQSYASVDLLPLFRVYFRELPSGLE